MNLVFIDRIEGGWVFNLDNQDITVKDGDVDKLKDVIASFNKLGYMLVGFKLMPILKELYNYGIRINIVLYDLLFVNRLFVKQSIDDLNNVYQDRSRIERIKTLYSSYSDLVERCYCTYNLYRFYIPSYMMAYYMSLEPIRLNWSRIKYIRDDLLDDNKYIIDILGKKGLSSLNMNSVKQWVKKRYNMKTIRMDDVYDIADKDDDVLLAVEGLNNIKTAQVLNDLINDSKNGCVCIEYDVIQSVIGRWNTNVNFNLDILKLNDIIQMQSDKKIVIVDFKQIDLYVIAYISGDKKLLEDLKEDRYIHEDSEEWLDIDYDIAKRFNYAVFFMANIDKLKNLLAQYQIKKSDDEIKEVVKRLHNLYPNVKGFYYKTFNIVRDNGYVRSILGRRRYYEISNADDVKRQYIGAAINMIQMSVSDVISAFAATILRNINKFKILMFLDDKFIFEIDKKISSSEVYDIFNNILNRLRKELNIELSMNNVDVKEL